ncbi:hypothetical protein FGIG_05997 [Fasciola gigantica]|uniref:Uncharacterized protein n=1 Tax=Fasciola gigantica TaxID=46835 RepID=A0A504YY39_FASGI|nr:hypothetical protein FGIG_05997 [Fasciola gigantica]
MKNSHINPSATSSVPSSPSQSRRVSSIVRSESEDYENFLLGKGGTITGAYVLHRKDTSTQRRLSNVSSRNITCRLRSFFANGLWTAMILQQLINWRDVHRALGVYPI